MRTKTANEIRKILKYLVSPDEELMNLGVGLFKECYLLTQLGKNEKFSVKYEWPGLSSNKPHHFKDIPRYGKSLIFTKGQFIKMLDSNSTSIYKKAGLILSYVHEKVDSYFKNRNSNYTLKHAIDYYEQLNDSLIANQNKLKGKKYYRKYLNIENEHITSQLTNFDEEINQLNLNIDRAYYEIYGRNITPNKMISFYKNYLYNRYNKNSQESGLIIIKIFLKIDLIYR